MTVPLRTKLCIVLNFSLCSIYGRRTAFYPTFLYTKLVFRTNVFKITSMTYMLKDVSFQKSYLIQLSNFKEKFYSPITKRTTKVFFRRISRMWRFLFPCYDYLKENSHKTSFCSIAEEVFGFIKSAVCILHMN